MDFAGGTKTTLGVDFGKGRSETHGTRGNHWSGRIPHFLTQNSEIFFLSIPIRNIMSNRFSKSSKHKRNGNKKRKRTVNLLGEI